MATPRQAYLQALSRLLKEVDLTPVKKITVSFDPFAANVLSAREFLTHVSSKKVKKTNLSCNIAADVKSDRSGATVNCLFNNGHNVLFKADTLVSTEMLEYLVTFSKEHSVKK